MDKFHALFGEKPDGSPLPDEDNPHIEKKKGPFDDLMELISSGGAVQMAFGKFATNFARVGQNIEAAAANKFLPIVRDILPDGLGKMVGAVTGVIDAFIARGKELQKFSGALTTADAIVSVRGMMADFKEAQVLGGGMARMTVASDQIWHEVRDLLLPIKEVLVNEGAELLQQCADALQFLSTSGFMQVMQVLAKMAKEGFDIARSMSPILIAVDALAEANKDREKQLKEEDMLKFFIDIMQMQFIPIGGQQPPPAQPQMGPNLPLFQGA